MKPFRGLLLLAILPVAVQAQDRAASLTTEENYRWPGWYVVGIGRDVHEGDLFLMNDGGPSRVKEICEQIRVERFRDFDFSRYECWRIGGENGYEAYRRGDMQAAMELWRKEVDAGSDDALFDIGLMYAKGEGVPKDTEEALRWFRMAADRGDENAVEAINRLTRTP